MKDESGLFRSTVTPSLTEPIATVSSGEVCQHLGHDADGPPARVIYHLFAPEHRPHRFVNVGGALACGARQVEPAPLPTRRAVTTVHLVTPKFCGSPGRAGPGCCPQSNGCASPWHSQISDGASRRLVLSFLKCVAGGTYPVPSPSRGSSPPLHIQSGQSHLILGGGRWQLLLQPRLRFGKPSTITVAVFRGASPSTHAARHARRLATLSKRRDIQPRFGVARRYTYRHTVSAGQVDGSPSPA